MKISWNWLKDLLPLETPLDAAADLLTDIGLEVEHLAPFTSVPGGLEGLVTGMVVSLEAHPDADKLQIARVDIGGTDALQIVCGAPNVAQGQHVIVAPVGVTIHPVNGEPFAIRKAKIRGVASEGMLCAEDEIGLGVGHDGLRILPKDTAIGIPVTDVIPVYQDTILEIGLTANHADAFSQWGTALELNAALQVREIENVRAVFPESISIPESKAAIEVEVQNFSACPRYSGIVISDIVVGPSPDWMQHRLLACGMRPINNIVDVTNYVLLELGQPLHAFDLGQISGNRIVVRNAAAGTPFIGLDEKTYTLSEGELMICDAEKPLCIGGVFGGNQSGVQSTTSSIFLESAHFNGAGIRKTEARTGLKTDASARFAKGTDPEMTVKALERAAYLIAEVAGGSISGGLVDIYPVPVAATPVNFRLSALQKMSGTVIPENIVETVLSGLGIDIQTKGDVWQLLVPARKNDVLREVDIIEEVLRLYGYNHIPLPAGMRSPYTISPKPDIESARNQAGKYLAGLGFYEVFTNSISRSKYVEQWMPGHEQQIVRLMNSLNVELDSLRPTTLFSMLEPAQYNQNRKQADLRFFEFGKVFNQSGDSYTETPVLSLLMTGTKEAENWNVQKAMLDLFDLKSVVQALAGHWRVNLAFSSFENHPLLENAVAIRHNQEIMGVFGEVKSAIRDAFDLRNKVFFAEIFWLDWFGQQKASVSFAEIPKFPSVRRDLALVLDPQVSFEKVRLITEKNGGSLLQSVTLFDVYEGDKLAGKKSYGIGLLFQDDKQTLTDKLIDKQMDQIIRGLEKEVEATIRRS